MTNPQTGVEEKLEQQGKETGIRKFREKVRQENGSKLIVFDGEKYAIFDAYEIVILCGRNVPSPRGVPETIEKKDILSELPRPQGGASFPLKQF